ncbi:MAG: anhydro-N-acetylmuramic acid kinase [Elainellaceae cyanobacterium]
MHVVGLMSGTSADGIDAALIDISGLPQQPTVQLLAGHTYPFDPALQQAIWSVIAGEPLTLQALAELDDAIAQAFAQAALAIQIGQPPAQLIGSHGQTVYHRPLRPLSLEPAPAESQRLAHSLQLGRGDAIAHITGLPTIANFRQADIAVGGEGAPLVPAVDAVLLRHASLWRCVQNIGGIGNVTYLPPTSSAEPVLGWDTGPGNSLLDLAVQALSNGQRSYDDGGTWAASGSICAPLVTQWLSHPFFALSPPKSTGRELFGTGFLEQCFADAQPYWLADDTLLATLTELTAASIALSYQDLPHPPDQVLLCGGGRHNHYLVSRIQHHLPSSRVLTTDVANLSADHKEAIAFGVLAYWRWHGISSNIPSVTGASRATSLGELYLPPWGSYDGVSASMRSAVLITPKD